jgi:hypothetical protein
MPSFKWGYLYIRDAPDTYLAGYPANLKAGYRISGKAGYRISGSTYRLIVEYYTPAIFIMARFMNVLFSNLEKR